MDHEVISKISGFFDKRLSAAAIVTALGFFASPAWATCTSTGSTFCDKTAVKAFSGDQVDTSYTSNGFSANLGGNAIQSSGDPFDTDKVIENLTESARGTETLQLTFYTSYTNGELGTHLADIFLGDGQTDTFTSAIALGYQTDSKGLYTLNNATSYKTSEQIWGTQRGAIYGGEYQGFNNSWYYAPTAVTGNATLDKKFTTAVNVSTSTTADPGFDTVVNVTLSANVNDFNALFGSGLSVFWGTADCSNDPIETYIADAPVRKVPEPVTLSLFSAGIGGAALLRRRRKAKAA